MIDELIFIYKNEKNTNQLLKYPQELVDTLKIHLNNQLGLIKNLKDSEFKNVYELEYERYNYFLSQILFTRISKIMKYVYSEEESSRLLSKSEKEFRMKYVELMGLKGMDEVEFERNDLKDEVVAFICTYDVGMYLIDGNEVVLKEGEFYVCSVSNIKGLIDDGSIELV